VGSWVPILIPVNRGANPGFFPDPGQIGIPRFPEIPAKSGSGQNPEHFPDRGPIGIGKIPAIFPAKSGRGGAGFGDLGVWCTRYSPVAAEGTRSRTTGTTSAICSWAACGVAGCLRCLVAARSILWEP
jgi:hypothetical protein